MTRTASVLCSIFGKRKALWKRASSTELTDPMPAMMWINCSRILERLTEDKLEDKRVEGSGGLRVGDDGRAQGELVDLALANRLFCRHDGRARGDVLVRYSQEPDHQGTELLPKKKAPHRGDLSKPEQIDKRLIFLYGEGLGREEGIGGVEDDDTLVVGRRQLVQLAHVRLEDLAHVEEDGYLVLALLLRAIPVMFISDSPTGHTYFRSRR